ncbi:MAG: glutaredoxin [Chloroflexi bacterium]|nr:glutaredoxin [Chloroflexota bacterium]MCL5025341.1 glutaredoxin [Chloroflexota bacterium]
METATRTRPFMYGLSTCGWCAKARAWLEANADGFDLVYVDLLEANEREQLVAKLQERVGRVAFPMIFFGEECVVGYQPEEYERLLERE